MLSPSFDSEEHYLDHALVFLKHYQWAFEQKNIDIFTKKVLDRIPSEWIDYFSDHCVDKLHSLVQGHVQTSLKEKMPLSLKQFVDTLDKLLPKVVVKEPTNVIKMAGVGEKKCHEIALLAPIIHEECQKVGCTVIVDVGCGVGHLSQRLYNQYNYKVLGLESSNTLVNVAKTKQNGSLKFEQMHVDSCSMEPLQRLIKKHFDADQKVCLTGLHACADLSVDILKLFSNLAYARSLVIMSCCYHRMLRLQTERGFKNFPCSLTSKNLFLKYDIEDALGQPFLRLACQKTMTAFVQMTFDEHMAHAQQCVNRALLQWAADNDNRTVRRIKRKSHVTDVNCFEDYLNNLAGTHRLLGPGPPIDDDDFLIRMREKWTEAIRNDCCWRVEVLMGVQAAVQAVAENVILLDRVVFLKEQGWHCYGRKVTNDRMSPRSWAIIALKL